MSNDFKQYSKRRITIEALQWDGTIEQLDRNNIKYIQYNSSSEYEFCPRCSKNFKDVKHILLSTIEGNMLTCPGDFIIKGIKGELYSCKMNIFYETYSLVDDYYHEPVDDIFDPYDKFISVNLDLDHVELLHKSPLWNGIIGARTCYDSHKYSDTDSYSNKLGEKDKILLKNLIKIGHTSVIEHIYYTFRIKDVSRLFLQQLARHRLASYSVESTRYTLSKHLKNEQAFENISNYYPNSNLKRIIKYITLTGNLTVDNININQLNNIRNLLRIGIPQDIVKYMIPDALKTTIIWTINARSLRNFFRLRYDKHAHIEIRLIASEVYNSLPEIDKEILFSDIIEEKGYPFGECQKEQQE